MRKYVIERDVPGIGAMQENELAAAAKQSNAALAELGKGVQWQHSYLAQDKSFCVYLAEDEDMIRKHAELSGFPANRITEVLAMIDPSTGR